MFEYTKNIISKVIFSEEVSKKELEKAKNRLLPQELEELSIWIKEEYPDKPIAKEL